jgi:hypothetical protein
MGRVTVECVGVHCRWCRATWPQLTVAAAAEAALTCVVGARGGEGQVLLVAVRGAGGWWAHWSENIDMVGW